jgi:hypothetical protein
MFVTVLSRPVDPVLVAQSTARNLSLGVAQSVAAMIDDGRWSPSWPLLAEIRDLAVLVARMHDEIGDLCEQAFAERLLEAMASAAYEMIVQARLACDADQAAPSPFGDDILFDLQVETVLLRTFALLAI